MGTSRLIYRMHALRRMFERDIRAGDVERVVRSGEVIEDYRDDHPYPSRLLLGFVESRPLHVVAAENRVNDETIIVMVYEPDRSYWDDAFRQRKRP